MPHGCILTNISELSLLWTLSQEDKASPVTGMLGDPLCFSLHPLLFPIPPLLTVSDHPAKASPAFDLFQALRKKICHMTSSAATSLSDV